MNDIAAQVREHIIHYFLFDDAGSMLADDASLLQNGILDSTGVLDLLLFVEDTFGIHVADEDVRPDNFDSVNNLVGYIESKITAPV